MIKAGIIGATGYAGNELVRLLMGHKEVEIKWYGSRSYIDQKYAEVYQNMFEIVDDVCMDDNMEALAEQVDVIFTATPQGFLAGVLNEGLLEKTKIIDLSADFRIKDVAVYEKWYKIEHKSPQFIGEAVYGLCEVNRDKVKNARLVANPGCYTTCSILTAYPLVKEGLIDPDTLIIDAKSGTSGAGRGAKLPNLFCEVNENMKAYGVTSHRHTPEIEEQLGYAVFAFPMNVGRQWGMGFLLQSSDKQPAFLWQRFQAFFPTAEAKLRAMKPEEFAQLQQAVISQILQAPQTLGDEASKLSKDFDRGNMRFDSRDKVVAQIKLLTPQKLADFFHQAVVEPQGMAILSQISGSQNGKAEYVHPEGWKVWENVSALQQTMPLMSEKNE